MVGSPVIAKASFVRLIRLYGPLDGGFASHRHSFIRTVDSLVRSIGWWVRIGSVCGTLVGTHHSSSGDWLAKFSLTNLHKSGPKHNHPHFPVIDGHDLETVLSVERAERQLVSYLN